MREVHLLFVDLTKGYDTVLIKKFWQLLEKSSIINNAITPNTEQLYTKGL